jgi:hypothetical protein
VVLPNERSRRRSTHAARPEVLVAPPGVALAVCVASPSRQNGERPACAACGRGRRTREGQPGRVIHNLKSSDQQIKERINKYRLAWLPLDRGARSVRTAWWIESALAQAVVMPATSISTELRTRHACIQTACGPYL